MPESELVRTLRMMKLGYDKLREAGWTMTYRYQEAQGG